RDQNNIAPNNLPLNVLGINQSFSLPGVYVAQKKILKGKALRADQQYALDQRLVTKEVSKAYYEVVYWQTMLRNYIYLDSQYLSFQNAANRKFEQGESNYLEKLMAEAKRNEISIHLNQINESIQTSYIK